MAGDVLRVSAAYAVGLVAPGYLLARVLGSRTAWAYAVPLSTGLLLLGVLALDAIAVPVRLGPVLAWELALVVALAFALWRGRRRPTGGSAPAPLAAFDGPEVGPAFARRDWLVIGGTAVVAGLVALRGLLAPLTGFDVAFRWEFLALQLLRHESLAFYPPVGADDFRAYFHPDGFAPAVSAALWWIYAAAGRAERLAAAPLAIFQYGSALGFAWAIGRRLHSPRAGWLAAAVLASSPLFVRGVLIGQETGLTALAVAGMTCALVEPREIRLRDVALAGALGGVGGLVRDYGIALLACGGLVLAWRRAGWRYLLAFGATALLVNLPWLVRNALRCGNPFYALSLGFLPVNRVYLALLEHYRTIFGLGLQVGGAGGELARLFLVEAGGAIVAGIPGAVFLLRRHGYLLCGAALTLALWALSVGYTSGGVVWSMRVLTPALLLLAVAGGVALARWEGASRLLPRLVNVALLALLLHGAAWAAVFPREPASSEWRWPGAGLWSRFEAPPPSFGLDETLARLLAPGTRILGDDAYAHARLANVGSTMELLPVWSPELEFLFDGTLGPSQQRARLVDRNVTAVLVCRSANTPFLTGSSPFYAAELPRWDLRGTFRDSCWILAAPER
jgi:hypothetical protein